MKQQNLKDKILKEIETRNLKITPRWYFNLIEYSLIFLLFVIFLINCISLATTIYILDELDLKISLILGIENLIQGFPYFWLISFLVTIGLAYFIFIDIKKGYRYSFFRVLSTFLVICIFFGSAAFASGVGEKTEKFIENKIPHYEKIQTLPDNYWLRINEGFISGEMESYDPDKKIINITDNKNRNWQISLEDPKTIELANEPEIIEFIKEVKNNEQATRNQKKIEKNIPIKIKAVGELSGNVFKARAIKSQHKAQRIIKDMDR